MKTEVKKYDISDYVSQCPLAKATENTVNDCATPSRHVEKLMPIFGYDDRLYCFLCACLLYWAKTQYYDERNKHAVLVSREIVKKFPELPHLKGVRLCEELEKEAYAFTHFAHRALQATLFKAAMQYFRQTGKDGLYEWYESQAFVIDAASEKAIPWAEYKAKH